MNSLKILEAAGIKGHKAVAELLLSHIDIKNKVLSSWECEALVATALQYMAMQKSHHSCEPFPKVMKIS